VRTFQPKPSDIERAWHVIDADGAVLGKLASQVAQLLRGKHKPTWAPHVDTGDHVVVVNAARLDVSVRKAEAKQYYRHSGYPGGIRSESLEHMLARDPERVVRLAVRGMLPKGPLGRQMIKKLRVYAGPTHPHAAQQPQPFALARGTRERTPAGA
jgi:large subunit ribosomal protein L13